MGKNYKNPARYRLDFIKENTFNRVWSLRMTRTRVIVVTAAVIASGAALLWCIMAYTPMRQLLPGALRGNLRNQYLETALKLDSLEQAARINNAYIANIVAIMKDDIPEDSAKLRLSETIYNADSLLTASEAEHQFVREYESEERFNLSVLAPIAAEGMVFGTPTASVNEIGELPGIQGGILMSAGRAAPATTVYRGTVLGVYTAADGSSTVTIQHPNDFVSIYSHLGEVFVSKGKKVAAGQRIGHAGADGKLGFELWHNGTALDPRDYISF